MSRKKESAKHQEQNGPGGSELVLSYRGRIQYPADLQGVDGPLGFVQGPVEKLLLEFRAILPTLSPAGKIPAQLDDIGKLAFEAFGAVLNGGQEILPRQGGAQAAAAPDQDPDPEQDGHDQHRQAQSQGQLENGVENKGERGGGRQHEEDRRDPMPGQQAVIPALEAREKLVQGRGGIRRGASIFHLALRLPMDPLRIQ